MHDTHIAMKKSIPEINRFRSIESIVYIVGWLIAFSIPFFHHRSYNVILWDRIFEDWIKMGVLLIIFILNIRLLIPLFLFEKKYGNYIGCILIILSLTIPAAVWTQSKVDYYYNAKMPPMEIGSGLPMELGSSMPPPEGYRIQKKQGEKSIYSIAADYLIFSLLLIGASTTLKLASRWITEENLRREIEKEQLRTELSLLRYQVSPHFLMNTLNNIHALIDLDVERAKNSVIKLSVLMRYLLYETSHGMTTLRKELDFIESYISLMKIRYPENVVIEYEVPAEIPEISLPPMLFISFLENAFKHGISYQKKSFVKFRLDITTSDIICRTSNSKHTPTTDAAKDKKKYSGIGLTNVRKNLNLLYRDNYSLVIDDKTEEYDVTLTLPLHYENKMHSS